MAKVIYNADELDGPLKVEEGIRAAFEKDGTALVKYDAIENVYEIVTDNGETKAGTFSEKCDFLCQRLKCTCEKDADSRVCTFRLKSSRGD